MARTITSALAVAAIFVVVLFAGDASALTVASESVTVGISDAGVTVNASPDVTIQTTASAETPTPPGATSPADAPEPLAAAPAAGVVVSAQGATAPDSASQPASGVDVAVGPQPAPPATHRAPSRGGRKQSRSPGREGAGGVTKPTESRHRSPHADAPVAFSAGSERAHAPVRGHGRTGRSERRRVPPAQPSPEPRGLPPMTGGSGSVSPAGIGSSSAPALLIVLICVAALAFAAQLLTVAARLRTTGFGHVLERPG